LNLTKYHTEIDIYKVELKSKSFTLRLPMNTKLEWKVNFQHKVNSCCKTRWVAKLHCTVHRDKSGCYYNCAMAIPCCQDL